MNSPATALEQDTILEIISYCPTGEIEKFRLLNKECNKRMYESFFINRHLHRTNSIFGYFIQYLRNSEYSSNFVSGIEEKAPQISLKFLPSRQIKIKACDTNNGILLCVDNDKFKGARRIPDYIVCKPTTKQYRVIPNPKTRYFTIATGLMVIRWNPFRYKIVRVSEPRNWERRKTKEGFYNLNCEVFDSDLFAWKRLNDLELPYHESFNTPTQPVMAYGMMHWLTNLKNVIRFCMQTETWSFFPVPDDLVGDNFKIFLVSYEGKLGVSCSNSIKGDDLWVLENSFGKSWVKVKDVKIAEVKNNYIDSLWFQSNDVVSTVRSGRLRFYNMNSKKSRLHTKTQDFYNCIPFYSSCNRVDLEKKSA